MGSSYTEKCAWISLLALVIASLWYLNSYIGPLVSGSLEFSDMFGAVIGLIIVIVVVETAFHTVAAFEGGDGDRSRDERDALIDAKSDRWPSYILGGGVISGIFASAMQPPIITAHILLLALVLAEGAKLVTQLLYYRRGV